jgi:hypothetical protein
MSNVQHPMSNVELNHTFGGRGEVSFELEVGTNNLDFGALAVFFGILNKILLFLMQMGEFVV